MDDRKILLLTGAFAYREEQMETIKALGYTVIFVKDETLPLEAAIPPVDVSSIHAVVCNGLFLYNDIRCFRNLEFIQTISAGLDRLPLGYIRSRGIRVENARGVYSIPIAEWVVLKVLEIYKKSYRFYSAQKEHRWVKQRDLLELAGRTAVIVGYGSVGMEIAKRLKGFGLRVIGIDGRKPEQAEMEMIDGLFAPKDLDDVLGVSDILILALPLTEQTYHLINERKLAAMKDGSVLVNVSRGGVIDEPALIGVLNSGKLLGAALDVFEEEPLPEGSPLWNYENVLITPHNAFVSDRVHERLFELIVKNLKDFATRSTQQKMTD